MRVAVFCNGEVGVRIVSHLLDTGDQVCGVVTHPPDQQRAFPALMAAFGQTRPPVFVTGADRTDSEMLAELERWQPDVILSVYYGFRIQPAVLRLARCGAVNLHPSLLPYHRGRHPNVWTIIEGTPAGVTLHHMSALVDAGDIIARSEVPVGPMDTGQSLYDRLNDAAVELFERHWPAITNGTASRTCQAEYPETPCTHRARDLATLDEIQLDRSYTGRELLNLLRARTFPPHPAAWFRHGGRRIYVRVQLADGGALDE